MVTVLFACIHNAGRSQMAAALFTAIAEPTRARACSAGTHPADGVHPEVVIAMREVGIDLASVRPRQLTDELQREVDYLVTMGCGEVCHLVPSARRVDWAIEDPKGRPIERVREIREEIRARVAALVVEQGWGG